MCTQNRERRQFAVSMQKLCFFFSLSLGMFHFDTDFVIVHATITYAFALQYSRNEKCSLWVFWNDTLRERKKLRIKSYPKKELSLCCCSNQNRTLHIWNVCISKVHHFMASWFFDYFTCATFYPANNYNLP